MASNTNYFAMIDDDNDFEMWQGLRGPAGPAGPAGKSAYEAAQEGGYTGSEAQFNAALAEVDTALQPSDVDTELSPVSTNPVQNRAVYEALAQAAIKKTVTGNPVTFYGLEAAENLYGLKVNIKAVQAAGTPSPDNKIPISGWNNVRIWNKATYDPTLSPTATIALSQVVGQAVYGGTLNVKTGKLVIDYDYEDGFDYSAARGFSTRNGYTTAFISYQGVIVDPDAVESTICDSFVWDSTEKATGFSIYVGSNSTSFYFTLPGELTAEQWRARMTEIHPMIVGKIATPVEVDLTPLEVAVLVGQTNNVWSDAGTVTVTFAANEIEIDGELSDTSENPVQNKVITEALENVSIPVDNQLNLFSANPVENRVISNELALQSAELVRQKSAIDDLTALTNRKAGSLIDTASGAIASFVPDSTVPNLLDVTVDVEPVQDLHGYDNPWPAGDGVNKYPESAISGTINGVTVTQSGGSYALSGTSTAYTQFISSETFTLPAGTYTLKEFSWDSGIYAQLRSEDGQTTYASLSAVDYATFTLASETTVKTRIVVNANVATNRTIQIEIVSGSTAPTTYSPYSNICPISGWSAVGIEVCGKNLLDATKFTEKATRRRCTLTEENGILTVTCTETGQVWFGSVHATVGSSIASDYVVRVEEGNEIVLSSTIPSCQYMVFEADDNYTVLRYNTNATGVFLIGANTKYITFRLTVNSVSQGTVYNSFFQAERGSTATAFKPYAGNTYTITLGQTVYGGTLDAVNGTMTVTWGSKTLNGTENWAGTSSSGWYTSANDMAKLTSYVDHMIADRLPAGGRIPGWLTGYVDTGHSYPNENWIYYIEPKFASAAKVKAYFADNPTLVVYTLATPIEIQLDPVQIAVIRGQTNNIWADAGDVDVTYAADIKAYIDRLNQPIEEDMVANNLIASGKYFTVNNRLFISTASIAAGAQIIPGTNCTETSLAAALNALNA